MSRLGLVDAQEFARLGLMLEGRLPVAGFARLASSLCDGNGELSYRLQGSVDDRGKALLQLEFDVVVRVICQRCLEPMGLPLQVCNRFRLLGAEPEWSIDASEFDADGEDEIVATEALDVEALIEDEVMLSLPLAPRHQNCALASGKGGEAGRGRESPFGVLAQLKDRAAR
jgi:uncharacterized protein